MNSERQGLHLLDSRVPNSNDLELLMSNSAFLWGMSAFTTGLITHGEMPFYEAHLQRLLSTTKWLWEDVNSDLVEEHWITSVEHLGNSALGSEDYRFRFAFFRDKQRELHSILSLDPFVQDSIDSVSLILRPSPIHYSCREANPKVGTYLDTFREQSRESETILFYNTEDLVLETSVANIVFYRREDKCFVLPVAPGEILQGIGIRYGLAGLNLSEEYIKRDQLKGFDSAFIINSLRGPQPVVSLDGRSLVLDEELTLLIKKQFELNKKETQRKIWPKENT